MLRLIGKALRFMGDWLDPPLKWVAAVDPLRTSMTICGQLFTVDVEAPRTDSWTEGSVRLKPITEGTRSALRGLSWPAEWLRNFRAR